MKPNASVKLGIKGFYKMVATKPDGTSRVVADWFPNLITDSGLDYLGYIDPTYSSYIFSQCLVGTGSTAPANTDTALATFLAGSVAMTSQSVGRNNTVSPYYSYVIGSWRFNPGVAAGNLTEIGVAPSKPGPAFNLSAPLFSRSLIKDTSGTPITVTILPDETLDVYYEYRVYPMAADATGSFSMTILGAVTNFDYVIRAAMSTIGGNGDPWYFQFGSIRPFKANGSSPNSNLYGGVYAGAIGAVNAYPTGASGDWVAATAAYVAGNKYIDGTFTCSLTQGNVAGGIASLHIGFTSAKFQMSLTPKVAKLSTQTWTITLRLSWDRI